MSPQEELHSILVEGKASLGMAVGIVSRIEGDDYTVVALESEYDGFNEGDVYELGKTYCRDVALNHKTMTYPNVSQISEMLKHPVYLSTQLRAYIGAPVVINDGFWGTLNFSSQIPRNSDFSADEYQLVERLADRVAAVIAAN